MRAISITGFKNSGKTTLTAALAQALEKNGVRVAIVKHTHHGIDIRGIDTQGIDSSGTDTAVLSAPGRTVLAVHAEQSVLFYNQAMPIQDLLPLLEADIVLLEGGKKHAWLPRILCLHSADEAPELQPALAIASYGQPYSPHVPHFALEDVADLASLVQEKSFMLPALDCGACAFGTCAQLARAIVAGEAQTDACQALAEEALRVTVNGQPVGLNPFVARMMGGALRGMLLELKGARKGCKAELSITL